MNETAYLNRNNSQSVSSLEDGVHDAIWTAIINEAEEICDAEQELVSFIHGSVLCHETLEDALIQRLVDRLRHPDMKNSLLRSAFRDVLDEDIRLSLSIRSDIQATLERDPACHRHIEPLLYFKGYQAIQAHRFAHGLWQMDRKDLAFYVQMRASEVFQVDIHPAVQLGNGIMIDHGTGVVIGETAVIGDLVSILQNVTLGGNGKDVGDRHPKIGNGVLIGAGAQVLGNISIGKCSRVAAGSVVLKDVPHNVTVAGVPAKVVGEAGCSEPSVKMNHMLG